MLLRSEAPDYHERPRSAVEKLSYLVCGRDGVLLLASQLADDPVVGFARGVRMLVSVMAFQARLDDARPALRPCHGDLFRCALRYRDRSLARRDRLNDLVAVGLELLEQHRYRHRGGGMNVVQQQDAAVTLGLDATHGALDDLRRLDAVEPVIGNFV